MQEKLQQLKKEALEALDKVKDKIRLEEWENKFLGRKSGELTNLMKGLKDLSDESKTVVGRVANEVKQSLEELAFTKRQDLATADFKNSVAKEKIDISEPSLIKSNLGSFHPNTIVQKKLEELFSSMGFMILDGPELESDYYNFEALNIPPTHPARDMQDTFYIKDHKNWVMRTHTSPRWCRAAVLEMNPLMPRTNTLFIN